MKKLFALVLALALIASFGVASAATKLVIGASSTPHAEILEAAKPLLEEKGIELEIVIFDDYVQPNLQLESGDLDANYFQHIPYLEDFNASNGTHLVSAGAVHYEPMGIYAGKSSDLANIPDGATIAVPNDTTNESRALTLLQAQGIITLSAEAGQTATAELGGHDGVREGAHPGGRAGPGRVLIVGEPGHHVVDQDLESAGDLVLTDPDVLGAAGVPAHSWASGRTTITGHGAAWSSARDVEPRTMPAKPPRPWDPTTTSCAPSDCSTRARTARSRVT